MLKNIFIDRNYNIIVFFNDDFNLLKLFERLRIVLRTDETSDLDTF